MDTALRALREAGFPWAEIARTLGVGDRQARERAKALGIPTEHISSGLLTGVAIVAGARPKARRFARPSEVARLGKRWR